MRGGFWCSHYRGVKPRDVPFVGGSLSTRLKRSKTLGSDRSVGSRQIFINASCFIERRERLHEGWRVLCMAADFDRDYLVPSPTTNCNGCLPSEVWYDTAYAMQNRVCVCVYVCMCLCVCVQCVVCVSCPVVFGVCACCGVAVVWCHGRVRTFSVCGDLVCTLSQTAVLAESRRRNSHPQGETVCTAPARTLLPTSPSVDRERSRARLYPLGSFFQ